MSLLPLPPGRLWLYARVSRDDQDGRSCDQQIALGTRDAERERIPIAGIYRDDGRSASQYARREREDWERMVDDMRRNGQPGDRLWGFDLDRLTRNRLIWAKLIQVCQEKGMYLWVGGRVYDTNNPQDMFFLDIQLAKAVAEVGDTRKRILRDVQATAEKGRPSGQPGYGYTHVYDPETGRLAAKVPHPEQADVVREMARLALAGHGWRAIARSLNDRRIPNSIGYVAGETMPNGKVSAGWTAATVVSILNRPALMGKRIYRGRIIDVGGWEPIVDPADWWMIQKRIAHGRSGDNRDGAAIYLLSGIATCGAVVDGATCGAPVYAQQARTGAVGYRRPMLAYRCTGFYAGGSRGHVSRKMARIDEHVLTLMFERMADPDWVDALAGDRPSVASMRTAEAALARARAELEELYADVEAGRVSRRLAAADEARLEREIAQYEEAARPLRTDPLLEEAVAGDPEMVWTGWTMEQRRRFLRLVAEEIRVLPVGRIGRREVPIEQSVAITWRGQAA